VTRYVPGQVPTTNDVDQLRRWLRDEFQQIQESTNDIYSGVNISFDNLVGAGHGNMISIFSQTIGALNATYKDVTTLAYNPDVLPAMKNCTPFQQQGIGLDLEGVWFTQITLSCQFDPNANIARSIWVRQIDPVLGIVGGETEIRTPVGRNVDAAFIPIVSMYEVKPDRIGNPVTYQVAAQNNGTQVFSNFVVTGATASAHHVSEFRDTSPATLQMLQALGERRLGE